MNATRSKMAAAIALLVVGCIVVYLLQDRTARRAREINPVDRNMAVKESESRTAFRQGSWKFAGYATPGDGVESVLWAGSRGDMKTLTNSFTPAGLAWMWSHNWHDKPEK